MVTLLTGDCRELLVQLAPDSIDAVVCDPPYDLTASKGGSSGFMGLSWDATGVAFSPATWVLVLRVLKPGGHLLAFGGTRTYHRMACAIEDAGFEIRDSIHWGFGTGFPKSLNVSKGLADARCTCAETPEHRVQPMWDADLPAPLGSSEAARDPVQPLVPEQNLSDAGLNTHDWQVGRPEQPGVERGGNVQTPEGQLPTGALRPVPGDTPDNGPDGWLRDGASSGDGDMGWPPADADGGRAPLQSPPARKRARQSRTVARQTGVTSSRSMAAM